MKGNLVSGVGRFRRKGQPRPNKQLIPISHPEEYGRYMKGFDFSQIKQNCKV